MNEQHKNSESTLSLTQRDRLQDLCDTFHRAWKAGEKPCIDDYLDRLADLPGDSVLLELVVTELILRREQGEQTKLQDYARFVHQQSVIRAAFSTLR